VEIYRVGGAVRDRLLGRPVQDEDFVVVGATAEEMVTQGFIPVGKDFPVFLHPKTHQEYALARTERKSGRGYKGFQVYASPEVTLEEDLARRDLTINAMAEDNQGHIIDPFHGQQDLQNRLLRHVSLAFMEDPVRILRVARFAARFQFTVAAETMAFMQTMVARGEVDSLVPERIWQEISRGLMEPSPAMMFSVLEEVGALPVILPELVGQLTPTVMQVLNEMAEQQESLVRRFAALTFSLERQALQTLGKRLRLPQDILTVALILNQEKKALAQATSLTVEVLLNTLLRCDALRRLARFEDILVVISWCMPQLPKHTTDFLLSAAQALRRLDGGEIAARCTKAEEIPLAIRQAQHACLASLIASNQAAH
jgi:tRNA nucleotidyltransferase (CCA-adding enzyme)